MRRRTIINHTRHAGFPGYPRTQRNGVAGGVASPTRLPLKQRDWDLGHLDGRPGVYAGPQHASCNRKTAGRKEKKR